MQRDVLRPLAVQPQKRRRGGSAAGVAVLVCAAELTCLAACQRAQTVQGFPNSFAGVGLELTMQNDQPVVVRTLEGGPAAQAGIRQGDRIVHIDGQPTEDLTLGDVVVRLRGKPGSQVTLGIKRGKTTILVVLRRARMVKGKHAYRAPAH